MRQKDKNILIKSLYNLGKQLKSKLFNIEVELELDINNSDDFIIIIKECDTPYSHRFIYQGELYYCMFYYKIPWPERKNAIADVVLEWWPEARKDLFVADEGIIIRDKYARERSRSS